MRETNGIEQSPLTPLKIPIPQNDGAKSGALESDFFKKYPDFANIIAASNLSKDFKKAIIASLKYKVIL